MSQPGHPTNESNCLICDFVDAQATAASVYEDEHWFAGVLDGLEIPGWIVLGLRRHALDPMGMNAAEAASFGTVVHKLSTAIQTALGSERVYLVGYGENAQHWHVLLSSRGAEIPPEHRHAQFWAHRGEYVDPDAALQAAERVRAVLLEGTSTPTTEEVA